MSNTYFKHRITHKYTWYSNNGKTRKIDFILTEPFVQKYMTNCRVYRGINIDTDHRLLKQLEKQDRDTTKIQQSPNKM